MQNILRAALIGAMLTAPIAIMVGSEQAAAQSSKKDAKPVNVFSNMKPRLIGPAYPSGRISDFAFHPVKDNIYYVATASGGVFKTVNNGTTWQPIFDKEASYATGVIEMDPNDVNTLWVGTGENNAQRSVANGDGVYKSVDGGKSWENVGLKDSGHISQIWINPADSDHVLVASQGPLWSSGGDRGLYKTTDGGKTWELILEIDEHTGINEFAVDPANTDRIVASSYQRRRHTWTLINGGPSSGIHRTTDGGKSWKKVKSGMPSGDLGRIGIAQAPSQPNLLYAIIEADAKGRGVYASTDFGVTWKKRSSRRSSSPQYYNELFVDPSNPERIYATDTFTSVSHDGGRTWNRLDFKAKHVDDHAAWIDPKDSDHIFIGGDGGVYESFDMGKSWRHMNNLPITQFYRISPDNALPFYNVCGGTQDNNSLCAPSRTSVNHGITNSDWNIILGGDGYKAVSDPTDPNIVYTQYQYGGLARYDRRSQERVYITPQPASGEDAYKWNWNTPIIVSPHKSTRLYYAAEKLFVSDDRGNNWRTISPDLTRQLDRNKLKVMGRVWSEAAIAKNDSTSIFGSIIGLSESPLKEGLLFVGTDDGLIQVSENGGESWRKVSKFKGVPEMSLVEDVIASVHDENVVYAVMDNHKQGDYLPYVLKSTDKGKKWKMISGNLPKRGTVHTIAEDHKDPNLLFAGTEYGLFFTQNGGKNWHQIKSGFPTIAVRDLEIQRRENDLVIATFGRGIYILDDYSPMRSLSADVQKAGMTLFEVKDPWQYIEGDLWGGTPSGSMGDGFWRADNPMYGAVFTYHLADGLKTERKERLASEAKIQKKGEDTPYPSFSTLKAEDREEAPSVLFTIKDAAGNIVRKIKGKSGKGMHKTAWDLRYDAPNATNLRTRALLPWESPPSGPLALPGAYTVTMSTRIKGTLQTVGETQSFTVKSLDLSPGEVGDRQALLAFQNKTADLRRATIGAGRVRNDLLNHIAHLKAALLRTPNATEAHEQRLRTIKSRLDDVGEALNGDRAKGGRNEPVPMSINGRIGSIVFGHWDSQGAVTGVHSGAYDIAAKEFAAVLASLKSIKADYKVLEAELGAAGAPPTPGRMPDWQLK